METLFRLKYSKTSSPPYRMFFPLNWFTMRADQAYCSQFTYDSLQARQKEICRYCMPLTSEQVKMHLHFFSALNMLLNQFWMQALSLIDICPRCSNINLVHLWSGRKHNATRQYWKAWLTITEVASLSDFSKGGLLAKSIFHSSKGSPEGISGNGIPAKHVTTSIESNRGNCQESAIRDIHCGRYCCCGICKSCKRQMHISVAAARWVRNSRIEASKSEYSLIVHCQC